MNVSFGVKRVVVATSVVAALVLSAASASTSAAPTEERSTFIVVLEPGAGDAAGVAARLARQHGGTVGHVYEHALSGFSIEVPGRAAAAIANNPSVAYVEADQVMSIDEQAVPTGISRIFAPGNGGIDIDGTDDWRVDVDVAVIDTGIDLDHPDLDVVRSIDCTNQSGGPPWARTVTCDVGGDDDNNHGTHIAGTVAAIDNGVGVVGVAPGARLWAVKVLEANGSGTTTGVIAGIDWVAARASEIEVANMSLGGGFSQSLNDAVANAVAKGVTMVVAAGNDSADAKNSSPASEPTAVTVSALADFNGLAGGGAAATCRSDIDDTFADFSNYGSPIDIIAPGVCIRSTVPGGYATYSGTSMAAPHVAGAAALLASGNNSLTPADIASQLRATGNFEWNDVDDPDATKEPLLDVSDGVVFAPGLVAGGGDGGGTTEPEPGTVTYTASSANNGSSWTATITVAGLAAGGSVSGTWSHNGSTGGCTGDATGGCAFSQAGIAKKVGSTTWTSSDGVAVVVTKP